MARRRTKRGRAHASRGLMVTFAAHGKGRAQTHTHETDETQPELEGDPQTSSAGVSPSSLSEHSLDVVGDVDWKPIEATVSTSEPEVPKEPEEPKPGTEQNPVTVTVTESEPVSELPAPVEVQGEPRPSTPVKPASEVPSAPSKPKAPPEHTPARSRPGRRRPDRPDDQRSH